MVESQVRALFEQMASGELPPSRVDIELAHRRGRSRLRWRRAGVAGAPVLAAAAVAVIALATGAAPGAPGAPGRAAMNSPSSTAPPAAGRAPAVAPRHFSPLIPYASFGWLPTGQSLASGGTGRTEMYLTAGPKPGDAAWSLTVYAAGRCTVSGTPPELDCAYSSSGGQAVPVTSRAPAVRGHRAFWAASYLVWQYARGGWAWLAPPAPHGVLDRSDAVKVADHVRYGVATAPVIAFPAQLTHVPRRWQVSSVHFRPAGGVLRASQYTVTAGAAALDAGGGEVTGNLPAFTTDPAGPHSSCYYYPGGESTRETVNGYQVTVNHIPAVRGNPPGQQLCAADADGLAVFISESGRHPAIGVVSLFQRHLRLLGTNPANWTRAPIG